MLPSRCHIRRMLGPRCLLVVHSNLSCSRNPAEAHLRRAQAVELLRSNYLASSRSPMTMTITDLDDMVAETGARPSLLLNGYGLFGSLLGQAARVAPAAMAEALTAVVNDVAEQSLNDSIREMSTDVPTSSSGGSSSSSSSDDVRETLKYHRDLRMSMQQPTRGDSATSEAAAVTATEFSPPHEAARAMASQALVSAVKLADVV